MSQRRKEEDAKQQRKVVNPNETVTKKGKVAQTYASEKI
jgi:hypothetical protein